MLETGLKADMSSSQAGTSIPSSCHGDSILLRKLPCSAMHGSGAWPSGGGVGILSYDPSYKKIIKGPF